MATTTETTTETTTLNGTSQSNVHTISSPDHFREILSTDLDRVSLLNFWAPWAEPCKQMNEVVLELAKKYPQIVVLQIEAEAQEEISDSFEINSVPTFITLRGHTLLSRIEGADAVQLTDDIGKHARTVPQALAKTDKGPAAASSSMDVDDEESPEEMEKRLRGLMNQSRVVLFMKGSPDTPRCGFSRQTVSLLREHTVEFTHFDILTDERVRSGLKEVNKWPTYPQLIVNGEFVGGLDIIREMIDNGEFDEVVKG